MIYEYRRNNDKENMKLSNILTGFILGLVVCLLITMCSSCTTTKYDAARVNLGEPWKMPTKEQFKELVENCTSERTTLNGYLGRRFTSKINGASIFLPFAGYISGTSLYDHGSLGSYWSSSLYSSASGYNLYFNSGGVDPADNSSRFYGFSVRAVQ